MKNKTLSLLSFTFKEWKRCDDKQGYRTCFTKYNQGNDHVVDDELYDVVDDDDAKFLRIYLSMVERRSGFKVKRTFSRIAAVS